MSILDEHYRCGNPFLLTAAITSPETVLERDTAAHSADGAMNIEVAIEDAQATLRSSRRTVGTRKRPVVVGSGADVEEDAASAAGDAGVETQSSRVGVTTRSQRSTVGLRGREPPIQVQAERHVSVRAGKKRKETHGDEDDDRSESAIEAASAEHQHAPMNTDAGVGAPSTRSRSSKTQDYRSLTPRPQRDSSSLPLSPPLSLRFGAAQQSEECSPSADGQAESGDSSSGSRESTVDDSHPHSRFQEDLRRLWARGQEIPGSIEPEPDRKEHANSDEVVDSDTYLVDDESTYSEEGVVVPDESAFNDEDVSSHRERVNNENVVNDKPVNNTKRRSRKGVPKPKHIVDAVAIEELVNLSHNNKAFIRKVVTDPTLQSAKDLISLGMLVIMLESVDQPTDASRQETISPIKQMSQNSSASLMYIARQHKSRAPLIDAIWKLYLAICASKLYETYPQEFAHVSREKHRRLAFDMTIAADIDVLKEEGYNVKDLEKEYLGANTRKRDHVFRGAHKILYLFMELGPQVLFTLGRGAGRTALGKKKIRLGDKKGLMTLVTYDK